MKCQNCEKPATFHITDLTGSEYVEMHLCADCAREHLQPGQAASEAPTLSGVLEKQLKIGQTAEELKELDSRKCPVCGISFLEFRQSGRLGCPNDYDVFGNELEGLLLNIHGSNEHKGKHPVHHPKNPEKAMETIQLRRQLRDAVEREEYEEASGLRDRIKQNEGDAYADA